MIEVMELRHELLKQFVDSIYVLKNDTCGFEFTAYPTANTPVGLFRNTRMNVAAECVYIESSDTPNHFAIACNQLSSGMHLQYLQLVDEIAINFKPLGFSRFSQSKLGSKKVFCFVEWDEQLPGLFNDVFATADTKQQLQHIEKFLLKQYTPSAYDAILLKALELLNDTTTDYKMQEIAGIIGIHYKQLYRQFTENIGCSLAHYRNLVKFRTSVASKIVSGDKARLVDVCYNNGYTDQPYFIRQFKKLTGEKPTCFFRKAVSFGKSKVIFKID